MAQFRRLEVALQMEHQGIIPVFYSPDLELCKNIVAASYRAGLRAFEFTNRGDFAHETFAQLNRWAVRELPGVMLGVGSVVDGATASLYIQLGANFIISPHLNEEMARVCNRRKILWTPGCGSLTEIGRAEELGAEIVKIFPASCVGGPEFVKAVKGPCPWSSIMPTGGVEPTLESLKKWFDAGVTCVGIGSNLFPVSLTARGAWDEITAFVASVKAFADQVRQSK